MTLFLVIPRLLHYEESKKFRCTRQPVADLGDQSSWQIAVEDSGIGIPSEHLNSIFDEFKQVSSAEDIKGAGLGLAITKRLVEELKGTIEVFSRVGQGSRFVVTLPNTRCRHA